MDLSDKLKTVLSDPDSMAKIMDLAQNFSLRPEPAAAPSEEEHVSNEAIPVNGRGTERKKIFDEVPYLAEIVRVFGEGSHERVALLQAMRPFVREEKQGKLDKIIQTLKALELLSGLPNL